MSPRTRSKLRSLESDIRSYKGAGILGTVRYVFMPIEGILLRGNIRVTKFPHSPGSTTAGNNMSMPNSNFCSVLSKRPRLVIWALFGQELTQLQEFTHSPIGMNTFFTFEQLQTRTYKTDETVCGEKACVGRRANRIGPTSYNRPMVYLDVVYHFEMLYQKW